jgi:aminoglycoside phosphotransferase
MDVTEPFSYHKMRQLADVTSCDASKRLEERYPKFNIPSLTSEIAKSLGRSPSDVTLLTKLAEGTINRVLEATMSDGKQVIAKVSYQYTISKHYATASEEATLEYLRLHGIPVPQVHGWCSTVDNAVGTWYIVMEKIEGTALNKLWPRIEPVQQQQMMKDFVELESNLFSLDLEAGGSI